MLKSIADELQATVLDITPKLQRITESASVMRPSPEKWSKKEIMGHLIDSATNNHQRFVRSQLVNPLSLDGYEQERWVATQKYRDESWKDLISLWKSYNIHLAHLIACVPDEKLGNTVQLGQSTPVTLEFLMKDYLRHLKHHLDQILGSA